MITVALADDEPLFTAGLAMILDAQPDMRVLWQALDGADAVRRHRREAPDVLLCDIQMPHTDGLAATEALVSAGTSTRIIMLTTFDDDEYVLAAIEYGAAGMLLKNTPPDELLAAIRTVHAGNAVISPGPTRRLFVTYRTAAGATGRHEVVPTDARIADALTPREREVLDLVAHGLSNQEICDRVQLVLFALRTGISRLG